MSVLFLSRWFWHFYAISVCCNGLLLVLYLNFKFQHRSHPSWLTGILDVLTGVPNTARQGELTCLRSLIACVFIFHSPCDVICVCSATAVHPAGAAAALGPLLQETARVSVCQCFLWWSHAFGAVHVWTGVLHRTRLDGALLR